MLSAKQVPYTGPYHGPSHPKGPNKGPTAKALKRALIRLGYFEGSFPSLDEHYNAKLERAMRAWQRTLPDVSPSGQYGSGSWEEIRKAKVPPGGPHVGEPALDALAQKIIRAEAKQPPETSAAKAISDFCIRAETVEQVWHYTQRRPYTGLGVAPEQDHGNDCSSYVILAYYWARQETGQTVSDPSGYAYSGFGNTWDDLDGHPRVSGSYLIGDLAHYDGHVTICRKVGDFSSALWSSFGREAGPEVTRLYYRDDLRFVVRPRLP